MTTMCFPMCYEDATEDIRAQRTADANIGRMLGYRVIETVNEDGDDTYGLISPSGLHVDYDVMPNESTWIFFEDSVWWYLCPQFTKILSEIEKQYFDHRRLLDTFRVPTAG